MKETSDLQLQIFLVKLLQQKSSELTQAIRERKVQSGEVEVRYAEIRAIKEELRWLQGLRKK